MKSILNNLARLAIVIVVCGAPLCVAQNTNMYFNGGFQGNVVCGLPDGCAGTGFYDGSINNVNVGPGQASPGFVCDDYLDNVTTGETWKANGINVASLNSSNISQTLFGSSPNLSASAALTLYAEMAYLMNQMFTTNPTAAQQASYSEALWYLSANAVQPGKIKLNTLDSQAQTDVTNAELNANTPLSQYGNLWIYTPSPMGPGQAQEMWSTVAVSEGGSAAMYLLLAALSCCAAMLFRIRSRDRNCVAA